MTQPRKLDVRCDVLDHELVDVDGMSCGMVDDVELEQSNNGPSIVALLVGPGAWAPRLPALAWWLASRIAGRRRTRVPWSDVAKVSEVIRLTRKASELGLGEYDRKVGRWLSNLPMT